MTLLLIISLVITIIATIAITDFVLNKKEENQYNEQLQSKARNNATIQKHFIKTVGYTPWSGDIDRYEFIRHYTWTDTRGKMHTETESWYECI